MLRCGLICYACVHLGFLEHFLFSSCICHLAISHELHYCVYSFIISLTILLGVQTVLISGFYFSQNNIFFHALPERRVCCVSGKLLHLGGEEFSKVFSYLNLVLYHLRTKSWHCQIPGEEREPQL